MDATGAQIATSGIRLTSPESTKRLTDYRPNCILGIITRERRGLAPGRISAELIGRRSAEFLLRKQSRERKG